MSRLERTRTVCRASSGVKSVTESLTQNRCEMPAKNKTNRCQKKTVCGRYRRNLCERTFNLPHGEQKQKIMKTAKQIDLLRRYGLDNGPLRQSWDWGKANDLS